MDSKQYTDKQMNEIRQAYEERLNMLKEKAETEKNELKQYYEEKTDKLDKECCQLRRAIVELAKRL